MNSRCVSAKLPFSVGTPRTNRNNGCPRWEGLKEKIARISEAWFDLENPEVNSLIKGEQENFYSQKIAVEILYRDQVNDGLGQGCTWSTGDLKRATVRGDCYVFFSFFFARL